MNAKKFFTQITCIAALSLFPLIALSQTDTLEITEIEDILFNNGLTSFENDSLNEVILTEDQMADFKDKALRKTKALSNYISTIANKSKDNIEGNIERDRAIDQTVKLFMNENCIVEVSSLNDKKIKRFKIREYLRLLKHLPYSNVKIEWFDIFYASNFKRRPDGKYEAVVTIFQKFSGTTNEGGRYIDITKKNILIVIDRVEIGNGDSFITYWDIFLGDIKVEETKKG